MALNPVMLAAMSDVDPEDSGLASGVVNTSFMMGGALGLAVLASIAAARSDAVSGLGGGAALNAGYQLTFAIGAGFAAVAAIVAAVLLRDPNAGAKREVEYAR
jgi:MFS family permease